jgi:hypothetical protein
MILLKSLLAQNRHSLHNFLNGVGVQNRKQKKGGADFIWYLRRGSREELSYDYNAKLAI